MEVMIGVSNRHIHLNEEDLKILFGDQHELTNVKDLVQPGQFVTNDFVDIQSDKGKIEHVRIIGPIREYTQVEISKTDAVKLKLNPPIRDSGNVLGSAPITIIGPNGTVNKEYGCILANRHIHMTEEEQKRLGLEGLKEVSVKVTGEKGGIFNHVMLKVNPVSRLELHIDTDDANSFLIKTGDMVEIIKGE